MVDWKQLFESQCKKEGIDVPETNSEHQGTSNITSNNHEAGDSNPAGKSSVGFGIGSGKLVKSVIPPQTSFGSTANRNGGSGIDIRGPAKGSADFKNCTTGGNILVQSEFARNDASHATRLSVFARMNEVPGSKQNEVKPSYFGNRKVDDCEKTIPPTKSESNESVKSTVGGGFGSNRTVGGGFGKRQNIPPSGENSSLVSRIPAKHDIENHEKEVSIRGGNQNEFKMTHPAENRYSRSVVTSGGFRGDNSNVPKNLGNELHLEEPMRINQKFTSAPDRIDSNSITRNFSHKLEQASLPITHGGISFSNQKKTYGNFPSDATKISSGTKNNGSFMNMPPAVGNNFRGSPAAEPLSMKDFQNAVPFIPQNKFSHDDSHEKAPLPEEIALLNKYIHKEVPAIAEGNVTVDRMDPKSPLFAAGSFKELRLKSEVLKALETLGFELPTRIQETALPLLLMEPPSNLIAQAQSGTGKTAAFVLTMLCRVDTSLNRPQCICLAPTIELAKQIGEVVKEMGRFMPDLKVGFAIKRENASILRNTPMTDHIIIGTPGSTRDYIIKYKIIDPSGIKCLVLDEADVIIYQQGFMDISISIYNKIQLASPNVQSMLFSATYDAPVVEFATSIIKNAIVVINDSGKPCQVLLLKREEQALPNIKQFYIECPSRESKFIAIVNLYSGLTIASSVIFCHTKASVQWLAANMSNMNHKVGILIGDMDVDKRAEAVNKFKAGEFRVLITTNVFARGIDVSQVSIVINYDLPLKYDGNGPLVIDGQVQPDCETYLHRIGRTGRFGKKGIAVNFISDEKEKTMIKMLENHFQMEISPMDPSNMTQLESID